MSLTQIEGDLLNWQAGDHKWNVICHVCNAQRTMRSGLALAIKTKYPAAFEEYSKSDMMLGTFSVATVEDGKKIVNLIAQRYYGYDGKRYVDYEALYLGLEALKIALETAVTEGRQYSLAVPYKMASDRAGGSWMIVEAMLKDLFDKSPVPCYIIRLPSKN